jgi:hypothetical protein
MQQQRALVISTDRRQDNLWQWAKAERRLPSMLYAQHEALAADMLLLLAGWLAACH